MRVLKKAMILLAAVMFITAATGCSAIASTIGAASEKSIEISEVVSSNSNSLVDSVFGRPDWIEIHNASDKPVDLTGYSISTSKGADKAYALPGIKLDPDKYILLFCSNAIENMPADKYCTGFKISKTGGTLILSYKEGIVQKLDVPKLETDISYGITKDGSYKFFSSPTPGKANTTDPYTTLTELESSKSAELQITEVMPRSVSDKEPYGWVEIHNAGKKDIKLSDYYITEDVSNPTKARLPEKTLKPDEYAVLKLTGNSGVDELPFKISSVESTLMISNNFGKAVDTFSWDAAILPGISSGRSKTNTAEYFDKPTPGKPNGNDALVKTDFSIKEGNMPLRINEVLKDNTFSAIDEDGDRSPWLELYNTSDQSVSLADYAISDEANNEWKFILPAVEVKAKSYKIIYLSGKNRITDNEIHASFSLGKSDKQLVLTCTKLRTKQTVDLPKEYKDNVSYGLDKDGKWMYFMQPTPEAENTTQSFPDVASIESPGVSPLRINEVVATKVEKGKGNDWVEVYNKSDKEINLSGYYLSDTQKDLKKWPITDLKASANGYAVIEKYKKGSQTGNISISSSGERLFLSDPKGVIADQYDTGVIKPGMSSGLTEGKDGKRTFFKTPTKGQPNTSDAIQGFVKAPVFSEEGGYKSGTVSLAMSVSTPNAAIYYTVDGSTPTESSTKYTSPVSISSTQTVRAIAVAAGMLDSDEMVATYLFEEKHKIPVVCLSITNSDYSKVKSASRDSNVEKAGYVEYYEPDGKLGVRFPGGLMVAGAGTRGYAQHSFNFHLRGLYGRGSVTYPFFDNYNITTFKSFTLRNMGQDNVSRIRDVYSSMTVNGMNIDNMQSKFVALYINGEYQGLYEFKENQNEDYFASKHGVDADKIDMIRGGVSAIAGTNTDIKSIYSLSGRDMNNPENFKDWSNRVDSDYIMDYVIAQTYQGMHDMYNQKFARSQDYKMKWRALLYDQDSTWDSSGADLFGEYFHAGDLFGPMHEDGKRYAIKMNLYYGYYKNDEWKEQFVKRYAEVMNTILTPEKMLALFDSMVDSIKDEMPRHIKKWGSPSSMSSWNNEISNIRDMIKDRRHVVINQLKDRFSLSDAKIKELFPNG